MNEDLTEAKQLIRNCKETQNPHLDLGNCGITSLSNLPELFECTHLETLILSSEWYDNKRIRTGLSRNNGKANRLSSIPSSILNLKKIVKLIIGGSETLKWNIKNADILCKLPYLRYLDLSNTSISKFSYLQQLTALEYLDISGNKISDYSFIKELTNLSHLNIVGNEISDTNFLKNLVRLESLAIATNDLNNTNFLANLTNLKSLNLFNTKISEISSLENLTSLQFLRLSKNRISDISPLSELKDLEYLDLDNNNITDVTYLSKLSRLKILNLRHNKIKKIPRAIFDLNFKVNVKNSIDAGLNLYNNPIESPPIEILNQGRQSTLDWFEAKKKKLDEIKIILIGDPKAGKTSLLRRLKDDIFIEGEEQTDGINIEHIQFGVCVPFKKQTSLHKLTGHFWDFGGQEIMNATHQFFLTNRSVYILVLDARKDANVAGQVRYWVKRIKATGGSSSIIVVANQIDINRGFGFTNEYELQEEFPQVKYFIRASCKTGEDIELIREKLEELIPQSELFNTAVDERWISIKEQLQKETKSKHFLDETRFKEICSDYGIKEKDARRNAITFLHDLGLALHFEDLNLAEYYVLDPYWITYGVYQILTSGYAGKEKGVVSMDKLEFIVNEEEDKRETYKPVNYRKINYTPNQLRFLVEILNQFKLSFYLSDNSHFIIPDLLDTKEPNETTESIRKAEDSIHFIYEYEYLPKSIMPHIMVETNRILLSRWRTGCVLQYDGCKALITNYENRISLIVTGEFKKKREFMAAIRFLMNSINKDLSDKPIKVIPLPGVDVYVDYEELLEREKNRETFYTIYKPIKKMFEISVLLEGIPTEDEIRKISEKLDKILVTQEEIKSKLDAHYQYLLENINIKDADILNAIKEMNDSQSEEITGEIMQWIATAFENFDSDMDDKFNQIYNDLKKTDNVEMKLKLSVPLINLLGIDLETKFDVKNWAKKMYKKYELKIFKLIGVL